MVSIDTLIRGWNRFFFEPVSVYPMAVFRVALGCVLLADAIYIASNAQLYLGPDGLIRHKGYFKKARGRALSLFLYLPPTTRSLRLVLGIHFTAVLLLIIGFLTPLAALITFVTTRSLSSRGADMTNGGDVVARTMCFFLIFTPAGRALSVDALVFHAAEFSPSAVLAAPWAQRLMQIQLSLIYFDSFYWKLRGSTWRKGTAVYYACSNDMYRLLRVPAVFLRTPLVQIATWGVLALELALATGLWIEELQPWLILAGVVLHLGLGLFLSIHLFSYYMVASLMLFLDSSFIEKLVMRLALFTH